MVEVLEEVTARELLPQEAAAVMALAGGQGRFRCVAIECDCVFQRFEGPGGGGEGTHSQEWWDVLQGSCCHRRQQQSWRSQVTTGTCWDVAAV
jgi:hypothetical protein